ncbi:glycoside hydrolase family 15 protein [Caballeronia sp. LZ035]|uniref:glycoside hydrolase family 15 protein n=1 Tax=Caballeronia sp. LZ035 TaxID=3038568 RepID=UPI00285AAAF2|nr:glycoside hydrolase family 15 protein [Caballeronia sp. LZ035]MDR5763049.1 glycoside hydrolase family 15 protein [Caballeronia sp. LZ035]
MNRWIEDYAMLGNGETAALLGCDGSIDWLCWPRYDGDACMAALLGGPENGFWSISPTAPFVRRDRRYQDDTLVLETEIEASEGMVRLIDFMPVGDATNAIVRMVVGVSGTVRLSTKLCLRFNYGELAPWTTQKANTVEACVGPDFVVLRADVPLCVQDGDVATEFEVSEGQTKTFLLAYGMSHRGALPPFDVEQALSKTQQHWRSWINQFDDTRTQWPHVVRRSLLTLKALIHRDTGAMIAAPTTSLPEAPGGTLNWDYRYCWLRDSCFALVALLNAGFKDEACAWRDWLLRTIAGSPDHILIMYRIDGGRHLREWTVDWLQGYQYATPVRIGNAASGQKQVDVLGEVIDCLDVARRGGLRSSQHENLIESRIVEHLEKVWNTAGSGIWESRAKPRHYTYSRVMAWVALDRYIRRRASRDADLALMDKLVALKTRIHNEVYEQAWNEGLGTFTQYYGGDEPDASLLLLTLVGFLPADDPRMAATIETIGRELNENGLIRRHKRTKRGPNEGAFLACSCWMADCLHMQGRTAEARLQFERVLAVANDLGLFSEQYNVSRSALAGNFPQALTHLAVVNTALGLCGPTLQRGGG